MKPSTPEKYRFRYRLLASADIIGSTAYKSGQASQNQSWAHVFRNFFDEFPREVERCFNAIDADFVGSNTKPKSCMSVWKYVGDEILFETELGRHEAAAYHVLSLKDALNRYAEVLAKKHRGLGLKGTVWGAGFPVTNVDVETKTPANGVTRDFLGPSIDLGFRLMPSADRRRIPVSADIAMFLRSARTKSTRAAKRLRLFLDPPQELKGIHAGSGYPMLWVDRLDGEVTAEDTLLGRNRATDDDALHRYLEDLFQPASIGLLRPFIESDPDPDIRKVPVNIVKQRESLINDDPDLLYGVAVSKGNPKVKTPKGQFDHLMQSLRNSVAHATSEPMRVPTVEFRKKKPRRRRRSGQNPGPPAA